MSNIAAVNMEEECLHPSIRFTLTLFLLGSSTNSQAQEKIRFQVRTPAVLIQCLFCNVFCLILMLCLFVSLHQLLIIKGDWMRGV